MEILKSMIDPKIVMAIVISFIIASILGPIIIPLLHKLKFGQNIREEGPKSHLKKAGTPTIGGLIFIFATIITMIIMVRNPTDESMIALYAFVGFGFVGFLDDLLKILKKKNEGLTSGQKMILLLIVSGFLTWYAYKYIGPSINIPFFNGQINLGLFYIPAAMFYFAGVTNAVNLTDGLDGLATSVTVLVITFLGIISYNLGHTSLAIFCVALAGALLAFLRFNAFPARVFMGDTGSLALGGAVAMVALILKMPLILVLIGIIYVIETLSVILQVASFKLTGKRLFRMAPIHHHFEQLGWSETKIVTVFSIITVVFCFIAFASL